MIVMFRERGSDEIADNLEAAAEKQAEAHLKTQQLMVNKHKSPQIQTPANESPTNKHTKSRTPSLPLSGSEILSIKRSNQRTSVRNNSAARAASTAWSPPVSQSWRVREKWRMGRIMRGV